MYSLKPAVISTAAFFVFILSVSDASAGNDACKVLPAEKFSSIMGYTAKVTASTGATCFYKGPGDSGGMLMIINEAATPQTIAMAERQGSVPQGQNGKLGATFIKGTVLFSVGINGTDPSKVGELAAEVKRNLK